MPIDFDRFQKQLAGEQLAMPDGLGEPQVTPANPTNNSDEPDGDKTALAYKLERVTEKAIGKTDEILGLPLPQDANFGAVLRAQTAAANTVINAQIKVDENKLRRQTIDRLPEMLRVIQDEEKKLAAWGPRLPKTAEETAADADEEARLLKRLRRLGNVGGEPDG